MPKSTMQLIREGYELIKHRENWGQNYFWANSDGKATYHKHAAKFCAAGAVGFAAHDVDRALNNAANIAAQSLLCRIGERLHDGADIEDINDGRNPKGTPDECYDRIIKIYAYALDRWKDREPEECEWERGEWVDLPAGVSSPQ
jgi:hypothetical protein